MVPWYESLDAISIVSRVVDIFPISDKKYQFYPKTKISSIPFKIQESHLTELIRLYFQIVAGEKFCIVTVVGESRSCRNDDKHKSATLEACPVDQLNVRKYKNT